MNIMALFPFHQLLTEYFRGAKYNGSPIAVGDFYFEIDMPLPSVGDVITTNIKEQGALDLRVVERTYDLDKERWTIQLEIYHNPYRTKALVDPEKVYQWVLSKAIVSNNS